MLNSVVSSLISILILIAHPGLCANTTSAGLAWPNQLWVPMGGFVAPNTSISSYYTWSPDPVAPSRHYPTTYTVPFDFIPMLWGCNATYTDPFSKALATDTPFGGVNLTSQRDVLGFNEPEIQGQADCTPEQAASTWREVLEPLKERGYRLGSPAVTSGDMGREWLEQWYEACAGGCNPDFIALHWYDIDPHNFITHLQDYHTQYNLPIWVTEYAVQNFTPSINTSGSTFGDQATLLQIELFMDVTRLFMESVDWVERYFWFGAMYDMQEVNPLNTLFEQCGQGRRTGALNALGVQYARINGSLSPNGHEGGASISKSLPIFSVFLLGYGLCTLAYLALA